jgi:hypothetical protein
VQVLRAPRARRMSAFFRKIPARLPHEGAPSRCTGASSNRANGVERPSRQNRRRVHAMAVHALCVIRLALFVSRLDVVAFSLGKILLSTFRARPSTTTEKKNSLPSPSSCRRPFRPIAHTNKALRYSKAVRERSILKNTVLVSEG